MVISNQELGRLAEKQRSLALQNMSFTLTCFDLSVNPKAPGAWGWKPWKGVRGGIEAQKNSESHQEIHSCKRCASDQFQTALQIWPLLKKVEFLSALNAPFERTQSPNAMWCFTPIYGFSIFPIFYVVMATSEGRVLRGEFLNIPKLYINLISKN